MPGLVDAHSHLVLDPAEGLATRFTDSDAPVHAGDWRAVLRRRLRAALAAGVTTIRDLGDFDYRTVELRNNLVQTPSRWPRLITAGPPLTVADGHCAFLGGVTPTEPEHLVAAVRERAERGVDLVKVMASGGMSSDPNQSQFDAAAMRLIVETAQGYGLPVAAHAHSLTAVRDCVAAGVTSIEHCTFMTDTGIAQRPHVIDQIAAKGIYVGATVARPQPHMPPPVLATLPPYWDNHRHMLVDRGIQVVVCSDAGINPAKPHNVLPHDLVYAATQLGETATLRSATSAAASACGLEDVGQIKPGFAADLLIVADNPTHRIETITAPLLVIRAGMPLTPTP